MPPKEARDTLIRVAHIGHQGINSTTVKLVSVYWWPRISDQVKIFVHKCEWCAESDRTAKKRCPPLKVRRFQERPFATIGIDLVGKLSTGNSKYILSIQDYFTKYGIIVFMDEIRSVDIKRELSRIFGEFETPELIVSDNGVQFTSNEFSEFLIQKGISHSLTPPYTPHANGQVERFNRCLKEKFYEAESNGLDNVNKFLVEWLEAFNTTPRCSTGVSSHELFYGFKKKTELHMFYEEEPLPSTAYEGEKVDQRKMKSIARANMRRAATQVKLERGNWVRVKMENGQYSRAIQVEDVSDSTVPLTNGDVWHKQRVSRVSHFPLREENVT